MEQIQVIWQKVLGMNPITIGFVCLSIVAFIYAIMACIRLWAKERRNSKQLKEYLEDLYDLEQIKQESKEDTEEDDGEEYETGVRIENPDGSCEGEDGTESDESADSDQDSGSDENNITTKAPFDGLGLVQKYNLSPAHGGLQET